jgi:hypothetical protein
MSAMFRALLMARVRPRWWDAQTPVEREESILPRSEMKFLRRLTFLKSM